MKAHLFHGGGHGIAGHTKTSDPVVRREYQREQDQGDGIKRRHDDLSQATTKAPTNIEPRFVAEARKRRATQQLGQPPSRGASSTVEDIKIAKIGECASKRRS